MSVPERFTNLLGVDFKVALQLRLPRSLSDEARAFLERSLRAGLAHTRSERDQVFVLPYASSDEQVENIIGKKTVRVLFPGDNRRFAEECFLVFRRKFDFKTRLPRLWLVVARHGEDSCFNAFSSLRASASNQEYVSLLYSSTAKKNFSSFKPLYVKIKIGDECRYFRIDAHGSGAHDILVKACMVSERESPEALQRAVSIR